MSTPLVSVIIPTYNRQDLVPIAINSVLRQTHRNIQLIVVNDGSTDQTKQVLAQLKPTEPRLTIINSSHSGHAHARNLGLQKSKGEFVAFLDDDDSWLPTKIAKQIKLFSISPHKKNLGIVYCYHYWVDQKGKRIGKLKISNGGDVYSKLIRGNIICGSGSAVMTKKKYLEQIGDFNENLKAGVDWEMWIRLSSKYSVDFVPQYLVNVRQSPGSVTKNYLSLFYNHLLIYLEVIKLNITTDKISTLELVKSIFFRISKDLEMIWIKVLFNSHYQLKSVK